jgi:transposase
MSPSPSTSTSSPSASAPSSPAPGHRRAAGLGWPLAGAPLGGRERPWLGYHLTQQLVLAGEQVSDVHPKLATRVRLLDRGHGRKTDQADARSVALVALRTPTLTLVGAEDDLPAVLRLLADRRDELNQERRRVTNRLHRLLRDLVAGGASTPLRVDTATTLLRRTQPTTAANQQRKALAHELLAD